MGRLSDIVLRGMQFEAEQESRALMDDARKLQMEEVVRERVAQKRRATPQFVRAMETFTRPDATDEQLGESAAFIGGEFMPRAIEMRNTFLLADAKEKAANERRNMELQSILERIELQQASATERVGLQQAGAGERNAATNATRIATDNPPPGAKPAKPVVLDATDMARMRDEITAQVFDGKSFNDILEAEGKVTDSDGNELDPVEVRRAVMAASSNAAAMVRAGIDPAAAAAKAAKDIKRTPRANDKQWPRKDTPARIEAGTAAPDTATTAPAQKQQVEADTRIRDLVEAAIEAEGAEIDEDRIIANLQKNGVKVDASVARIIRDLLPEE